jgi:hypothetical protein
LLQLQQQERALVNLDIQVVIVTFESSPLARAYVQDTGVQWPLLVDEARTLYRAYGMLRGHFWDIWGPRTWWAYAMELLRGRLPQPSHADTSQLGGDVLIDPEGTVRLVHVGSGPADRLSVATILAARHAAS